MLDFTSSLYLGMTHPSVSLPPWRALTLGVPAALAEAPEAQELAGDLAQLAGAEAGLLFPSTLHLFRDLLAAVAAKSASLLIDTKAYPIARWGTEQVQLTGTPCDVYPHHDAGELAKKARRAFRAGLRPVVMTDGLCPACGRLAPLPELARITAEHGGALVVDDTQAMGVVGRPGDKALPLGVGGGGTLAWYGLHGPHIHSGSSLAKGFGAPLAVLAGGSAIVERIGREGATRIHTSPPSMASLAAARAAVAANATAGDLLRARLARRIAYLRQRLVSIGAPLISALPLPTQVIALPATRSARAVLTALATRQVRALITEGCNGKPVLSVILTAQHAKADIDRLIEALAAVLHDDLSTPQTGYRRHEQHSHVRNHTVRQ
jgi:8-amino-7-oxononanoate synthase